MVQLQTFFDRSFFPVRIGREGNYASQCRTAVRWLTAYLNRPARLADLTRDTLDALGEFMQREGIGAARRETIRKRLLEMQLAAVRIGLLEAFPRGRKPQQTQEPLRRRKQPKRIEYAPGSVWEYFETVYRPQRLISAAPVTLVSARSTFRFLREWRGSDVLLHEQNDALAADFFEWLLQGGRRAVTVNGHRAQWFCVWRLAHERGVVNVEPKVRKLPEQIDEPDAWTHEEAAALIAATSALAGWPPIVGIPADPFFRALFLVAWWAALRRGSLLALRQSDVDLSSGWLSVPGASMKNRLGRRYRLGPDALDALRAIWEPRREFIFPWPWKLNRIYDYFDEVLRAAGVAPSTRRSMTKLHKWRRTVATTAAVERGMAAATALLNQSGPEVTRRYVDASKLPGNDATQFLPALSIATPTDSDLLAANRLLAAGDYCTASWRARIALERRVKGLYDRVGREFKPNRGLLANITWLFDAGLVDDPSFHQTREALHVCNEAVHGDAIGRERAVEAVGIVRAFVEGGAA